MFSSLLGEIDVWQGGDLYFISKIPDEAWGVLISWTQIVRWGEVTQIYHIIFACLINSTFDSGWVSVDSRKCYQTRYWVTNCGSVLSSDCTAGFPVPIQQPQWFCLKYTKIKIRIIYLYVYIPILYRMKIYTYKYVYPDFNSAAWLRLVKFKELNISKYWFLNFSHISYHWEIS